MRSRVAAITTGVALLASWTGAVRAQQPSTVKEQVEVREVPVLVQLPPDLAGKPLAEVARKVAVIEDGAQREIAALGSVAPPAGPGFGAVRIVVDGDHCDARVLDRAATALAEAAPEIVALGPVRVSDLGSKGEPAAAGAGATDAQRLTQLLAARAREGCPPAAAATDEPTPESACAAAPCLMIWVSAGWGTGAQLEAGIARAGDAARALATRGWTVVGFAPVLAAPEAPKTVPPETRPGDDRSSWTIDVLGTRRDRSRQKPEASYRSDVELSLAPLRRMAEVTAGVVAAQPDALKRALDSIRDRTLLYYRTDRAPSPRPAAFEVRRVDGQPGAVIAPKWAPTAPR
jgi:hypothetical protein